MAKLTLEIDEDYPFLILGISARTANYRLCWNINKTLGMTLIRQPDLILTNAPLNEEFVNFSYHDEERGLNLHLIENRSGNKRFIPELNQADFLLVAAESDDIDISELATKIKTIRQVLLVFPVDVDALKNKQNLLLLA